MWDVDTTVTMMRVMSRMANLDDLMRVFSGYVHSQFNVERALIVSRRDLETPRYRIVRAEVWNNDDARFRPCHTEQTAEGGLLAHLLYGSELEWMTEVSLEPSDPAFALLEDVRDLMAFPVFDEGETSEMVILLSSKLRANQQDLCGLAMMSGLLDRAIKAQEMVRRVEETKQELDRELQATANVQRWLLPSAIPIPAGVSIATSYQPARHAGGDYYTVTELPDGRLGVLIADVSGKGAPAAVLMAVVRTLVEVERRRCASPATLLTNINRHLVELGLNNHGVFVTAFCGVIDPSTRQLTYSSAGHHVPRLIQFADDQIVGLGDARYQPLALQMDTEYQQTELTMQPNDLLMLYTDGIVEARRTDGEFFGIGRLDQVLRQLPMPPTAHHAVAAINSAVSHFSVNSAAIDDQTLIALRIEQTPAENDTDMVTMTDRLAKEPPQFE